jgi:hypothetical protein
MGGAEPRARGPKATNGGGGGTGGQEQEPPIPLGPEVGMANGPSLW